MVIKERVGWVVNKSWLNDFVCLIKVKPQAEFDFNPGQFVMLEVGKGIYRAYSLASPPTQKELEMVIDIRPGGPGSQWVKQVKVGDKINFRGPFGLFGIKESQVLPNRIFIATGTGVAPFKSILEERVPVDSQINHWLYWGLRWYKDIYFDKLWFGMAKRYSNFKIRYCLSRETKKGKFIINQQRVTQVVLSLEVEKLSRSYFYICGSNAMVDEVRQILKEKGVDSNRIIFEKYG